MAQEGEPRGIGNVEQKAGSLIEHIPETPEISESLQQAGVRVQPSNPPITGFDPLGMAITKSSNTTSQLTLPGDNTYDSLKKKSEGNPLLALTWWATVWLRQIKIAWHKGRKVLGKGSSNTQPI